MAFTLFGWLLPRKQQPVVNPVPVTSMVDGSTTINSGQMSGYYGFSFDLDGNVRNEIQMINRYREVASYPDCDTAIEHIVNEAVIVDQTKPPVSINLDNLPEQYNDQFRQRVKDQFEQVIKLLNFNEQCHDIFKRWYVDGKLYYYITIDPKNPTDGILELKYVDPRKIRKVTEYVKETTDKGFEVVKDIHQYYIFNDDGLENAQDGIKLALDNVIQVKSGIIDANSGEVISYLYKAIKPVNQLKMMEDALVIYRITRAPERRIFYIDVGNMPNQKAEQYVQNIMNKFRNKVVYNSETGEITNNRNYMSMQEDFWLPRREGGRATEIQTLPPGCLAMDTKVSLLDGTEATIREIEHKLANGEQVWTYSCDPITGKVVPGLVSWAGVTQSSANVMRITLDNGQTITCTPDHKFPIKGFGFKRADQLAINDSLIPLYRRKHPIVKNKPRMLYEQFYDNDTNKWQFTHRMVANFMDPNCDIKNPVVHHVNYNRFDNRPFNLIKMSWKDHVATHIENCSLIKYVEKLKENGEWEEWHKRSVEAARLALANMDPEKRAAHEARRVENNKNFWKSMTDKQRANHCEKVSKAIKLWFDSLTEEQREKRAEICRINVAKAKQRSLEVLQDPIRSAQKTEAVKKWWNEERRLKRSADRYRYLNNLSEDRRAELYKKNLELHEIQTPIINEKIAKFVVDLVKDKSTHQMTANDVVAILNSHKELVEEYQKLNSDKVIANWDGKFTVVGLKKMICRFYGFKTWHNFRHNAKYLNHRIAKIEILPDPIEVGTLTIDIDEHYHNYHTFALSCGVFTKNSNLSEIADIEYFQHKLYQSLNVPRQRLLPETNFSLGTTAEITREEVAFNKFIQRLRNNFNVLLREALKVQMVLTKTCTMEEWEELGNLIFFEYQHDNYFEELKRVEILNERMTLLQTADGFKDTYFSKEWIVKNILQLTDDEWKAIKEQIADETHQEDQSLDDLESFDSPEEQSDQDMEDDQQTPYADQEQTKAEPTDDFEPNSGDDEFDRGAEPGLKVVK